MEIYIIRHGETVWNAKKLLQGSTDIELNENGRELAGITGQNLEGVVFNKIYSSPLIRAYETACLIRGHRNIPIIRDARLRELCFGSNEGKDFSKLLADESEHICERAKEFLTEVIEPQWKELERVMIVAHGAMNKALMCHVKQHGIDQYWSGGLQTNCNVIIVNLDENGYHVVDETRTFY